MPGPQRTADGGRRSDDAGGLYPVGTVSRLLDDIYDTEDALTFLLLVLQPPLAPMPLQELGTGRTHRAE